MFLTRVSRIARIHCLRLCSVFLFFTGLSDTHGHRMPFMVRPTCHQSYYTEHKYPFQVASWHCQEINSFFFFIERLGLPSLTESLLNVIVNIRPSSLTIHRKRVSEPNNQKSSSLTSPPAYVLQSNG